MGWSRKHLSLLLAFGFVLGAAAYSVSTNPQWKSFDAGVFGRGLRDLDPRWIVPAFLAIYATYGVRALRWRVLMRGIKPRADLGNLFSATVIGFGALGLLGRAGEFVRPYLIAKKEQVPISGQLGVWVLERALDMLIVLALVAFAVGHIEPPASARGSAIVGALRASGDWAGAAIAALLVLIVVLRGASERFSRRAPAWLKFLPSHQREAAAAFGERFAEGLHAVGNAGAMVHCLALSIVQWVLIAGSYYAVLVRGSRSVELDISQLLIYMGLVMAGSMFQIPGIGGGVQVSSMLVLSEIFGIRIEIASAMSILIWLLTFMAVIPPALLMAAWDGWSWSKLRGLKSESEGS